MFSIGSMALMDAGIPVRVHVAGVSVGLVSDVDPSTGRIVNYRILTDILVNPYCLLCWNEFSRKILSMKDLFVPSGTCDLFTGPEKIYPRS